jgi:hypothetical protein
VSSYFPDSSSVEYPTADWHHAHQSHNALDVGASDDGVLSGYRSSSISQFNDDQLDESVLFNTSFDGGYCFTEQ